MSLTPNNLNLNHTAPNVLYLALSSLTSVLVKRVLGRCARRDAPKSLLFRACRAWNSKGFSFSGIHASLRWNLSDRWCSGSGAIAP